MLQVQDIAPAVAAVEARLGGPQQYTEINATTEGVNLFVADAAGQEVSWLYADGALQDPGAAAPAQGTPFALSGVDITAGPKLVDQVQHQFPGATVVAVAVLQLPGTGLELGAQVALGQGRRPRRAVLAHRGPLVGDARGRGPGDDGPGGNDHRTGRTDHRASPHVDRLTDRGPAHPSLVSRRAAVSVKPSRPSRRRAHRDARPPSSPRSGPPPGRHPCAGR